MAHRLRVGILGAGEAGTGHAHAFARLPNVEVAALWSRTRQRARKLATELRLSNVRLYDDWPMLVEDKDIDILSVATPTGLHREPFLMALDRGLHVLVEFPLSDNLPHAVAMAQAAKRAKTVTAVCLNWRYVPAVHTIWREIQKGRIGPVRDVRTEYRYRRLTNRYYTARGAAHEVSGEMHVASLEFDKVRLLAGSDLRRIVTRIAPYHPPRNSDFTLWDGSSTHLVELHSGALASVRVTATAGEYEWSIVVCGDQGSLRGNLESVTRQTMTDAKPVSVKIPASCQRPEDLELDVYAWYRQFQDFVTAIRRGDVAHETVPYLPSVEDGLRGLQAVMAAERSAQEMRWVELKEVSD